MDVRRHFGMAWFDGEGSGGEGGGSGDTGGSSGGSSGGDSGGSSGSGSEGGGSGEGGGYDPGTWTEINVRGEPPVPTERAGPTIKKT